MRKHAFVDLLTPALDRFDIDMVTSLLDDNCYFQAGNSTPTRGKEKVRETLVQFFDQVKAVKHRIDETLEINDTVVSRGLVTYTRKDSSTLTVPVCDVFKIQEGKILEYFIYIDWSELF